MQNAEKIDEILEIIKV